MNDDIYPNDGSTYYQPSRPSADDVKREASETFDQVPLLKETRDYFADKIALLGNIDAIQVDVTKDADAHRAQVLANKLVKAELESVKGWIESRVEAAMKQD